MRINYDIGDLRAFCCLVQCGQYTAAASMLCITTSALSRRIAKLESEIEGKLFERTTRSLAVTQMGRRLYDRVLPTISHLDASMAEAARAAQGQGGTLAFATVASVGYSIIPKLLPKLYAEHPNIYVSIRDSNATVVTKFVEDGEAEFAVTTPVPFPQSLTVTKIGSYDFNLVYADPALLAPGQSEVTWRQLADMPVVGLHPLSSTRLLIDGVLHSNAIPRPWKLEVDQMATLIGLVQTSSFVAVMPALFDVKSQGLCVARIREPDIVGEFHIAHRTDANLSPAAATLIKLIQDHCRLLSRNAE